MSEKILFWISPVSTIMLVILTGCYVWLTSRLVKQAAKANGPIVYIDLELDASGARLVVGNAGARPATDVRLTIKEHLPRKEGDSGFAGLPVAKDGISYLAPRRTLKYDAGWIDQRRLFDGTRWFLEVEYSFVDHVGERVAGSFRTGFQQYSHVLFESFQKPTHGIADAIRELARTQRDHSFDHVKDMLTDHCPTCGEALTRRAKKCPHCWEPIPPNEGSPSETKDTDGKG